MGNKVIAIGPAVNTASDVDEATNETYVYKDVSMNATLKADVNTLSAYYDIAHVLAKESTLEKIVAEATDDEILLYTKSSQSLSKKAFDYVSKLRKMSFSDISARIAVKNDGLDGNQISVYSA